jgi:2-phosphoglycerate kinase
VQVIETVLRVVKEPPEKVEVSVLMHLLITLSYLCRERFRKQLDETQLERRIREFVEFYESTNREGRNELMKRARRRRWTGERCLTSAITCFTARRMR